MGAKGVKATHKKRLIESLGKARELSQSLSQMYERKEPDLSDSYGQVVCELDAMLDFIASLKGE